MGSRSLLFILRKVKDWLPLTRWELEDGLLGCRGEDRPVSKTYRSFYLTIQRNKMLIADWKTVVKEEGKKEWKCSVKCFLYEHLCPIISLVPLFPEVALKIKKIFELNSTIRTPF